MMIYNPLSNRLGLVIALVAVTMLVPARAVMAHCDTVDGPVVAAEAPAAAKSRVFELPASTGAGDGKEVTVLVDESHLKLATVALRGGTVLPSHSAPVPTTIQVLEGDGVIHVAGEPVPATKGTIVLLGAGEDHDVVPAPDSDMLLLVHYLRSPADPATARASSHDH